METINKIGLFGLLFVLFSCEGNQEPSRADYSEEPQFFSRLTIDGHQYRWAAGVDDYKLHYSQAALATADYYCVLLAQDSTQPVRALRLEFWLPQKLGSAAEPHQRLTTFLDGPLAIREPEGYLTDPYRVDYHFKVNDQNGNSRRGYWFVGNQLRAKGDSLLLQGVDQRSQTELSLSWVPDSLLYSALCSGFLANRMSTFAPAALQLSLSAEGQELRVSPTALEGELQSARWRIQDQEWQESLVLNTPFPEDSIFFLRGEFQFSNGAFLHTVRLVRRDQLPCQLNIHPSRRRHSRKDEGNQMSAKLTYYDQDGRAFSSEYRHSQFDFSAKEGLLSRYLAAGTSDSTSLLRFLFEAQGELRDSQGNKRSLESLVGQMGLGSF